MLENGTMTNRIHRYSSSVRRAVYGGFENLYDVRFGSFLEGSEGLGLDLSDSGIGIVHDLPNLGSS
jgi:hypothetical protein